MSDKTKAQNLAETFTDFVNSYGCDSEGFINAFLNQHRTLQQSGVRLMLQLIERMASQEDLRRFSDERNKASYEVSKKLIEGFKKVVIEEQIALGESPEKAAQFANSEYTLPSKFLSFV